MTQQHKPTTGVRSGAYATPLVESAEDIDTEGESGWEDDEDEVSNVEHSQTGPLLGSSNIRALRKRRRPAFVTKGPKKQVPTKSASTGLFIEEMPTIAREDVVNGLLNGTLFTGKYALDVSKRALIFLRYPLSFLFFLYLLALITRKMNQTFNSLFSPFCAVPGISHSNLCRTAPPPSTGHRPVQWADYSHLVDVESKTFQQLMDGVVGGSALSLEVKQAEMATADLVVLVRISDLKAKDRLATSLLEFIESAKTTGRGLQRLSSKVGGAVDSIMAANEYALKSIAAARTNEPSPWSLAAIVPWKPSRKATSTVVTETFEEAMDTLSRHLERLILEAQVNDNNLTELEESLKSLHELVALENSAISSEKSDLLADLWTVLGGNRRKLRHFDSHLALLKDLAIYRKQAAAQVVGALQTLRGMSDDMEEMRERVASPNLEGSSVSPEAHMRSIQVGLERLREGRVRARKLEQEAMRRVLSLNGIDE